MFKPSSCTKGLKFDLDRRQKAIPRRTPTLAPYFFSFLPRTRWRYENWDFLTRLFFVLSFGFHFTTPFPRALKGTGV